MEPKACQIPMRALSVRYVCKARCQVDAGRPGVRLSLDLRSGFAQTPCSIKLVRALTKAIPERLTPNSNLTMSEQLRLQIKNSFAAVHSANEAALRWLIKRGVPAEIQNYANLAIEEFATNSIKYGYDDTKEHLIEVSLSLSGGKLVLTIIDDGHAFNPLEAPEPKVSLAAEDRPVGGLGIYLVRKLSDRMEYARESGKNRLTLHKSLNQPRSR